MRERIEKPKAPSHAAPVRKARPESALLTQHPVQRVATQPAWTFSEIPPLQRLGARQASLPGASQTQAEQRLVALHAAQIHEAAKLGTSGASGPLPYLDTIQRSFGKHDLSRIAAYSDKTAAAGARAMNADAFTTGNRVAFAERPSLHTAAHEAAHVIQQRAGVQLAGGLGVVGDPYERHANAVADLVVQGRSAESLLDKHGASSTQAAVQRQEEAAPAVQAQAAPAAAPAAAATPAAAPLQEYTATNYHNPRVAEGTVPILNAQGEELGRVTGRGFVDASMEGTAQLSNGTQVVVDRFVAPANPAAYAEAVAAARTRYPGSNRHGVPLSPQNVGLEIPNRTANSAIQPATDTVSRVMVFRATRVAQGARGALRPYRSIAAPRNIPLGTQVYIQELQGRRLPDGTTHDGWVTVDDRGGNITGARIDFYTGNDTQEFLGGTVHLRIQGAARTPNP